MPFECLLRTIKLYEVTASKEATEPRIPIDYVEVITSNVLRLSL